MTESLACRKKLELMLLIQAAYAWNRRLDKEMLDFLIEKVDPEFCLEYVLPLGSTIQLAFEFWAIGAIVYDNTHQDDAAMDLICGHIALIAEVDYREVRQLILDTIEDHAKRNPPKRGDEGVGVPTA